MQCFADIFAERGKNTAYGPWKEMLKQCKRLPKVEKKKPTLNHFQKSSTITAKQFVLKPNLKDSTILVIIDVT